jgi:hypothetical protein
VFLVLGEPITGDSELLPASFRNRGHEVLIIPDLTPKTKFVLRISTSATSCELHLDDGRSFSDKQFDGAVVQKPPRIRSDLPNIGQEEYARSEKNAALFAWLWNLKCPVVNRYPPIFWSSTRVPLPFFRQVLSQCKLDVADTALSNASSELRRFASNVSGQIRYTPLSSAKSYPIETANDWVGLSKMAELCPVNLMQVVPPIYTACVVGDTVYWNQAVPPVLTDLEGSLVRLAIVARLSFMEIQLLVAKDTPRVCSIEAFPSLAKFDSGTRELIADALLRMLVTGKLTSGARKPLV